jgi:hypothetical protein
MAYQPPPEPESLGEPGRALWGAISSTYVIDAEPLRQQLVQVCQTADILDRLQEVIERDGILADSSQGVRTHPAVVEQRQQRIVFARLLAALGVPAGSEPARGVYGIRGA